MQRLAQKSYDEMIVKTAEKELDAIQKCLVNYPEKTVEQVYEQLHKERKRLISPIVESDEEFIQQWEAVEYQGKGFWDDVPELYTSKGESTI